MAQRAQMQEEIAALVRNFITTKPQRSYKPPKQPEMHDQLFAKFAQMDRDGKGLIGKPALMQLLTSAGGMTESDAKNNVDGFFLMADPQRTGVVYFVEFMAEWLRMQLFKAMRVLRDTQTARPGGLTAPIAKAELLSVLTDQMGPVKAREKVDAMYQNVVDKNGGITLQEICTWYFTTHHRLSEYWKVKSRAVPATSPSPAPGDAKTTPVPAAAAVTSAAVIVEPSVAVPACFSPGYKWTNASLGMDLRLRAGEGIFVGDVSSGGFVGSFSVNGTSRVARFSLFETRAAEDRLSEADAKLLEGFADVASFEVSQEPSAAPSGGVRFADAASPIYRLTLKHKSARPDLVLVGQVADDDAPPPSPDPSVKKEKRKKKKEADDDWLY